MQSHHSEQLLLKIAGVIDEQEAIYTGPVWETTKFERSGQLVKAAGDMLQT
jgi:hypothetical protein